MRRTAILMLLCSMLAISASYAQSECGPSIPGAIRVVSMAALTEDGSVDTESVPLLAYDHGRLASRIEARGEVRAGDHLLSGIITNTGDRAVVLTYESIEGLATVSISPGESLAAGIKKYTCRCVCDCGTEVNEADVGPCTSRKTNCVANNTADCIMSNGESAKLDNCSHTWIPAEK